MEQIDKSTFIDLSRRSMTYMVLKFPPLGTPVRFKVFAEMNGIRQAMAPRTAAIEQIVFTSWWRS